MRARVIRRWVLRGLLRLVLVGAAYVTILLYPGVLFAHERDYDGFRVYSDRPIPDDTKATLDDTARRVSAMESAEATGFQRVFLCHSPKRYAFFAFLTRRTADSLAIGLSLAGNTFVNMPRVERFRQTNRGVIRHSRFEGNLSEVIAHEIAHFKSIGILGFRRHLAQPIWKSEGWAEYQANLAAIEADETYDLRARIDLLRDDGYWTAPLARRLWESQLLVEYLGQVEGYTLEELVAPEVTESEARARMLAWYRGESSGLDPSR